MISILGPEEDDTLQQGQQTSVKGAGSKYFRLYGPHSFCCIGSVAEHHDVLRLDVPVDDPALMRVRKSPCDLPREVQHLAPGESPSPVHILPKRDTVYQFHDYVFDIIGVADADSGG